MLPCDIHIMYMRDMIQKVSSGGGGGEGFSVTLFILQRGGGLLEMGHLYS